MSQFIPLEILETAIETIRQSPKQEGSVELIAIRPETNEREVVESCELAVGEGVVGDNWLSRGYKKSTAHPEMEINLMNSRAIAAIAGEFLVKSLAGDQFFVDFDLSKANMPAGTRFRIGSAELEVTAEPHLGCKKFSDRFGKDAVKFVNSEVGKSLNMRGINAKVIKAGSVSTGASMIKL